MYLIQALFLLGGCVVDSILKLSGRLLTVKLSCCDFTEVIVSRGSACDIPPTGLEPMSHKVTHLDVHYGKLGTIIMHTVHAHCMNFTTA